MNFVKLEGLGNDFILCDALKEDLGSIDFRQLAPKLCNRHFGIGADGLLIVRKSDKADFQMQIINPDGSEPQMCGNGIRCFARYVYENYAQKSLISVETLAGIILPVLDPKNNIIEVDMGEPRLRPELIPANVDGGQMLDRPLQVLDKTWAVTAVSMGNPHGVIFVEDIKAVSVGVYGAELERHEVFPEKANIEFCQVVNRGEINMRVWERGAGETLACGTGACAAVVAGVLTGRLDRDVSVHLAGGDLRISWDVEDNHVFMAGPAYEVFRGEVKL
ncbi:diaminopimelate epimerase [Candidatus Termititenax persephonae]|uniref:Diaminopimelate epimerase n=1 Tax=Candidatus Termititenax persephonae TaxID=2218525 RepID=A0A388TFX3_9BACT|nr:diaminopimelate epimerase [Candidatus Termititenax persephonae]